jgi:glycosyltransferase involved in cell wall biosynthesis
MKVLHCIPSISPIRGGPSVAVLEMAKALRDRGIDARILTTNDAGPLLDHSMPLGSWFEHQGVPVIAFSRWSPRVPFLREFAFSLTYNRWLANHLSGFHMLHVHALFSWPSTSAMTQARMAQIPYVVSTIGQLNKWSLSQHPFRKQLFLRLIENKNLLAASALHFTTNQEKLEATSLTSQTPSWVIPLGVNPPASKLKLPNRSDSERSTTFLYLSRIHPKKQLERLIEALALLEKRRPEAQWQLNIAGDGDPRYISLLYKMISDLGLTGRCHWLGFITGQEKWNAFYQADWFVLPSASENFGIAAIEALAVGTPPILTPDVAVADSIEAASAGYVCSSLPSSLCVALEKALSGPSSAMKDAAINLASTSFSWTAIAARLEESYSSIIKS